MIIYPKNGTFTASSGTASATIAATEGMLKFLHIVATTSTTTFDVKLTDRFSLTVLEFTDNTGVCGRMLELPCYGNWTLTVENASTDESFEYLLTVLE